MDECWLLTRCKDGNAEVIGAFGSKETAEGYSTMFREWLEEQCKVEGPVPMLGFIEETGHTLSVAA